MMYPLIVCVAGVPKTGKTHHALTYPDPICLFSFDLGADYVLKKFPNKQVDLKTYPIPIVDTATPAPYAQVFYEEIKKDYSEALASKKYKTLVIDTATALWEIVRQAYTEELKRKRILRVEYSEPNTRMSWFLMQPQLYGVHLVATHYLKDKYVNDQNTGEKELDGFKRTLGIADIILRTGRKKVEGKEKAYGVITDNRFDLDLCDTELVSPEYSDLIGLLGWEE